MCVCVCVCVCVCMCVCVRVCEGCVYGKFYSLDCIYSPISSPLPPLSLYLPDFSPLLSFFHSSLLLPSLRSFSSLPLPLPDFSPLLPLSSHRECPKRRVSQPRPRGNVPAQERVPRVIGETPSRCCPLCLPGDTEERVLWTARTKWYCGLIPIPSWSQSHSHSILPHSHSSSIVVSFPLHFCLISIPNAIILEVFLLF